MTDYRFEVLKMLISVVAGAMSIKHMIDVCRYTNQENLIQTVYHGIWAITMLIILNL